MHEITYWTWIESEAGKIHTDGCTGVTGFEKRCCWKHDLEFYYATDSGDAYDLYMHGESDYWQKALPLTFEDANKHFRSCHFSESRLGYLNPVAWYRWLAVKSKRGRAAWDDHRAREAAAL